MTDWIIHDGGPQPVADDVWVEVDDEDGVGLSNFEGTANQLHWSFFLLYRILNQHLIDAARLEGIRLGLEAAFKAADAYDHLAAKAIRRIDSATIAKETAR